MGAAGKTLAFNKRMNKPKALAPTEVSAIQPSHMLLGTVSVKPAHCLSGPEPAVALLCTSPLGGWLCNVFTLLSMFPGLLSQTGNSTNPGVAPPMCLA